MKISARNAILIASPIASVFLHLALLGVVNLMSHTGALVLIGFWGAVVVLFNALFILNLMPNTVRLLLNDPNADRGGISNYSNDATIQYLASTKGFFTELQQGRAKWIERRGKPIRAIMAHTGHMWLGDRPDNDLQPDNRAFWEVVPTKWKDNDGNQLESCSHPIPFPVKKFNPVWFLYSPVSVLWWVWKRSIYQFVGVIFTGIYPWQTVRVYPLEHFQQITDERGITHLKRRYNYSDHYRVAQYQFPALVGDADTQDKVEIRVLMNAVLQVFNLYLVAYNTDDDWPKRVFSALINAVGIFTRSHALDQVLSSRAIDPQGQQGQQAESTIRRLAGQLQEAVKHVGYRSPEHEALMQNEGDKDHISPNEEGELCEIGIKVVRVQVLDITPTSEKLKEAVATRAVTEVEAQSIERLAVAYARRLREQGQALADIPHSAQVIQTEGLVRAVEAAKPGTQIFLGGHTISAGEASIVSAIKKEGGT